MKLLMLALIGSTIASLNINYVLNQDDTSGNYYFETYVGRLQLRTLLLIDTLANGTVIEYNAEESHRATIHDNWKQNVTLGNGGYLTGRVVTDGVCLDDDEDICIENFTFLNSKEETHTNMPEYSIDFTGVIPFNRYDFKKNANSRLVPMLDYEDIFTNSTMQMDLNFPSDMFQSAESAPKSRLTLNGVDNENIRWSDWPGQGITLNKNTANNSIWQVGISDMKWREQTIVKLAYPSQHAVANISTITPDIVMPVSSFENFGMALRIMQPDF
jgi:hypothetical protein